MAGEMSLGSFAKLLEAFSEEMRDLHEKLEHVAEHVEHKAKERIGHEHADWPPLAESTVRDRVSKGYSPNEPLLRTGKLRDSIHKEVHAFEAVIGSDSEVAVAQELGTDKIPPRSFLATAAMESIPMISATFGGAMVTAMRNAKGRV